jgi:hypothetical protein
MASDRKRLDEVFQHIRRIKAGEYPIIQGDSARGDYRIVERPFQDLAEPSKLAILQEAVNWSGVTNRDQAHILLAEIDPGRITDAQRHRLIEAATGPPSYQETLQEAVARGGGQTSKDKGLER